MPLVGAFTRRFAGMPLLDLDEITAGPSTARLGFLRDGVWDRSMRSGNCPETTRYNDLPAAAQLGRYLGEYSPDPDADAAAKDPVEVTRAHVEAFQAWMNETRSASTALNKHLFAGPTETLIVADETADPFTIAVDLLSQAEHGPDSPYVLITTSHDVGATVLHHVKELLPGLATRAVAEPAWENHGQVHVVDSLFDAYRLADLFDSEYVQILTANPREALEEMHNYGALFLGEGTGVAYGDKVIGTNHVLPTLGAALYTGGCGWASS
jgi:hypothetical protein